MATTTAIAIATGVNDAIDSYEVDGTGVSALVFDTGAVSPTHADFSGRLVNNDAVLPSPHATHVAGTVAGNGAASNGMNAGMAPGASIESFALDLTGGSFLLYTDPGDIELDYRQGLQRGVDVANASLGSNVAANGLPCSLIGDYGDTAALIDSIARGALGEPLIMTWSAGNERNLPDCGNLYSTIAPPAAAKNPIMIGATNSNDHSLTTFTSWGPTDDGRLRPDICAPGCQVGGDGGITSCALNGQYSVLCGTSMSAPTVCGLIALILESYRIQYPATDDPLNSTMKALLAHTALDLETLGPDYSSGYGDVQALAALDHVSNGDFFEERLDQGQVYAFFRRRRAE